MRKFNSFKNWQKFVISAFRELLLGIFRLLYSVVMGIVSLFIYIYNSINAFARREPKAMVIISLLFIVTCCLGIGNFMNERFCRVKAEEQRDSLAFKLDSARQNTMVRIRHYELKNK